MKAKYVYWQEKDFWVGYFVEFPDYKTQGENTIGIKIQKPKSLSLHQGIVKLDHNPNKK
jgi:hypothetical protein